MAGRKKTFPCGHRGKGRFCHRCEQEERHKQAATQAKAEWKAKVSSAPVCIDHLPHNAAERVLQVIAELEDGKTYMDFKGKRLTIMGQRHVISIPIGRRYRMICKDRGGSVYRGDHARDV